MNLQCCPISVECQSQRYSLFFVFTFPTPWKCNIYCLWKSCQLKLQCSWIQFVCKQEHFGHTLQFLWSKIKTLSWVFDSSDSGLTGKSLSMGWTNNLTHMTSTVDWLPSGFAYPRRTPLWCFSTISWADINYHNSASSGLLPDVPWKFCYNGNKAPSPLRMKYRSLAPGLPQTDPIKENQHHRIEFWIQSQSLASWRFHDIR